MKIVAKFFSIICGILALTCGYCLYFAFSENETEDTCLIAFVIVMCILCAFSSYKLWVGSGKSRRKNTGWLPEPIIEKDTRTPEERKNDEDSNNMIKTNYILSSKNKNIAAETESIEHNFVHDNDFSIVKIETKSIDPYEEKMKISGAEITYLDAKSLKFWNGKRTDFIVPQYYEKTSFGRNAEPALEMLLEKGYLQRSGVEKNISLHTIPELKIILSDYELKTSGKKDELIRRLLENLSIESLEELFPVGIYEITEKGKDVLKHYSILFDNESYSLGFSYYRLIETKEKYPNLTNEDIFIKLFDDDIQKCYKEKNVFSYQEILVKAAKYAEQIGKTGIALNFNILSYFVWCIESEKLNLPGRETQSYYLALNIDQCGKLCGYSLNELEMHISTLIQDINPFGLGTTNNINRITYLFKKALSIS